MSETITPQTLISALEWRYATKQFDPKRKIEPTLWQSLEEALRLTPSSYGVQPWKFIILTNPEIRERLLPHSWGQRQVADASHLVVFAIKKNFNEQDLEAFVASMEKIRDTPRAKFQGYVDMMRGDLIHGSRSLFINQWAARQVYIALGNFMTAAALLGIDACPLEGFEPVKYDNELQLSQKGLASIVACAAGYRAETDRGAQMKKVRFPAEDVFLRY